MLDIAVAYNRYRFLGNEFLTWIWYCIENDRELLRTCDDDPMELYVGNRMVLENRSGDRVETITIKGDAAGLEEGMLALKKGAAVIDLNLVYKSGPFQWQFSIKGESLNFSGLKLPETGATEQSEDMEGLVLDKLYLLDKPFQFIDRLYRQFILFRVTDDWPHNRSKIQKWVTAA